jgi:hypothetical protein
VLLKAEDWLLAGWVAVVSPLVFRGGGDKGPFDSGQPIEGLLRLLAVVGVIVCLAVRHPKDEAAKPSIINRASVGPFTGGLLLVLISGFTALDIPSNLVVWILLVVGAGALLVRFAGPPLAAPLRRALVTPFVVVAGGIYWNVIAQVAGIRGFVVAGATSAIDRNTALLALGFLALFSAVYYAMLIYAPRQVAEPEGGPLEWGLRYVVFLASIVLGLGWLAAIAG